ncbi:MAG: SGNH/GDSL hydrolase family protein [Ruminococcaceae bacterium]|nr:SGNH/GDSL hydrolase family protein [Oscillospiraceae bacterium]
MKKRIFAWLFITVLITGAVLHFMSLLLMPKYVSLSREGALVAEYYNEADKNREHQVVFLGDCEVYESFVPPILWERCGITSYVRGSAQQLIWQSYYLLEDILRYETPQIVVLNVFAMKYGEPQKEEYNRMTLDGMKPSSSKHRAILASLTDGESVLSYYFPILRFHSRWKELSFEDVKYVFKRPQVSHNGYLMHTEINGAENNYEAIRNEAERFLYEPTLPQMAFDYLDKTRALCESRGIRLILIKSPTRSVRFWWYDEWDEQICEYADNFGLDYYNFMNNEALKINWDTDTYDEGIHLNVWGAEKLSEYFGELLSSKYGLEDLRGNQQMCEIWEQKVKKYYEERNNSI